MPPMTQRMALPGDMVKIRPLLKALLCFRGETLRGGVYKSGVLRELLVQKAKCRPGPAGLGSERESGVILGRTGQDRAGMATPWLSTQWRPACHGQWESLAGGARGR